MNLKLNVYIVVGITDLSGTPETVIQEVFRNLGSAIDKRDELAGRQDLAAACTRYVIQEHTVSHK